MTATRTLAATLCGFVVLLLGVPPAVAANGSGVLATIPLAACCAVDEVAAAGGVVSLSFSDSPAERSTLSRIDLATNTVTATLRLPPGSPSSSQDTSSLVFADGSLWVPVHFEDEVLRVDPETLRVTARVGVGLSPVSIAVGGGSLWVALQFGRAVARIDPITATVVATVPVGRQANTTDGPAQVSFDGSDVLVSLPGSGRVAHIDPASQRVSYDDVGAAVVAPVTCAARVDPVPGGHWLDDTECSNFYSRWDAASRSITATVVVGGRVPFGLVVVNGFVYTAESRCSQTACVHGWLVKRDATTGAVVAQRSTGVEDFLPNAAAGSLWTADFDASTLQRVDLF